MVRRVFCLLNNNTISIIESSLSRIIFFLYVNVKYTYDLKNDDI